MFHAEQSTLLNNINKFDSTVFNKSVSRDLCPATWQQIFQGWSNLANFECNYWFCFVYKQIWWTTLSSLNSREIFSLLNFVSLAPLIVMVPGECCFYVYSVNVHFHRKKNVDLVDYPSYCYPGSTTTDFYFS